MLPPPGVYGGSIQLGAGTIEFHDGDGKTIPALKDAKLWKGVGGPFAYYVPDVKVLGGSIAIGGIVPTGEICGHLFTGQRNQCTGSIGDPYVEIDWSRFYGKLRPSRYSSGAYPIPEGLSVLIGFGVVIPVGRFDSYDPLAQALSLGTNIWDIRAKPGAHLHHGSHLRRRDRDQCQALLEQLPRKHGHPLPDRKPWSISTSRLPSTSGDSRSARRASTRCSSRTTRSTASPSRRTGVKARSCRWAASSPTTCLKSLHR
ncbi:MAG: hypothetical protein WDN31_06450 [Hyphomicrobium sp.]